MNAHGRARDQLFKVGTALKGKTYTVTKKNCTADWHQISYNGKTAYIHKSYLSVK